jgi:hypothetical protein
MYMTRIVSEISNLILEHATRPLFFQISQGVSFFEYFQNILSIAAIIMSPCHIEDLGLPSLRQMIVLKAQKMPTEPNSYPKITC